MLNGSATNILQNGEIPGRFSPGISQSPDLLFVLVIVPIALSMPAVVGAIPIAVIHIPAMLTLVIQFAAPLLSLRAVLAMFVDSHVEIMVSFFNPMLTFGMIVIRARHRNRRAHHQACQCRGS